MRLPLKDLNEWIRKSVIEDSLMDNNINSLLFKPFQQEYCIKENLNNVYKNSNIYLIEKYGAYDGQVKLCKDFAEMLIDDIEENKDSDSFNYDLTADVLKGNYKNIFFRELVINCNYSCQTGYDLNQSVFNKKTLEFDKVVIYINLKQYHTVKDVSVCLVHELTHVWDDFSRRQKPEAETLLDIHTGGYKDIIKKLENGKFMETFVSNIIYSFSSVERNAYISELSSVLDTIKDKTSIKNYWDAMKHFKESDVWKRYYTLKDYFENIIIKNELELTKFCDIYNRLNNTNWTETKIIKHVRQAIDKTFNKILSVIPKIYYDFISSDENVDESRTTDRPLITQSRQNRLRKYFPVTIV